MKFKLGSDPELVIIDARGQLKSAIPLISRPDGSGVKDKPIRLVDGTVIRDNVNVEFGIDPADDADQWVDRTKSVLKQITTILPAGYKMLAIASSDFPDAELALPEAREFGCSPDFDAYVMDVNVVPPDAAKSSLRSCGGHIHIGLAGLGDDIDQVCEVTKAMDFFLGLPSLLLDKDPTSARRRSLYGKAGCHRPKPYGVEYRALGNFWVSHPNLTRLMWHLVNDGLEAHSKGLLAKVQWNLVRKTINESNIGMAKKAVDGLVKPLLNLETRAMLDSAIEMPRQDVYDSWGIHARN